MWLASAFGGQGINTTAMAGTLVARGLVDGDDTWRLFAPYELIWAGGLCGRAAAQIAYGVHRVSEAIAMRNVARRETERDDGRGTAKGRKETTPAAAATASASDRQAGQRGAPPPGAAKQRTLAIFSQPRRDRRSRLNKRRRKLREPTAAVRSTCRQDQERSLKHSAQG